MSVGKNNIKIIHVDTHLIIKSNKFTIIHILKWNAFAQKCSLTAIGRITTANAVQNGESYLLKIGFSLGLECVSLSAKLCSERGVILGNP